MNNCKTNTHLTTILIKKIPLTHASLLDHYLITLLEVTTTLNFMVIVSQLFFISLTLSLPI